MECMSINHHDQKSPQSCEELIDHAERIYSLHGKGQTVDLKEQLERVRCRMPKKIRDNKLHELKNIDK